MEMSYETQSKAITITSDMRFCFETDCKRIDEYLGDIGNTYITIAGRLHDIQKSPIIADLGYKSFYDFAEARFGIGKSTVKKIMCVFDRFTEGYRLKQSYNNYSFSQLVELAAVPDEKLAAFNNDMTVLEMRALKRCGDTSEPTIQKNKKAPEQQPLYNVGDRVPLHLRNRRGHRLVYRTLTGVGNVDDGRVYYYIDKDLNGLTSVFQDDIQNVAKTMISTVENPLGMYYDEFIRRLDNGDIFEFTGKIPSGHIIVHSIESSLYSPNNFYKIGGNYDANELSERVSTIFKNDLQDRQGIIDYPVIVFNEDGKQVDEDDNELIDIGDLSAVPDAIPDTESAPLPAVALYDVGDTIAFFNRDNQIEVCTITGSFENAQNGITYGLDTKYTGIVGGMSTVIDKKIIGKVNASVSNPESAVDPDDGDDTQDAGGLPNNNYQLLKTLSQAETLMFLYLNSRNTSSLKKTTEFLKAPVDEAQLSDVKTFAKKHTHELSE